MLTNSLVTEVPKWTFKTKSERRFPVSNVQLEELREENLAFRICRKIKDRVDQFGTNEMKFG